SNGCRSRFPPANTTGPIWKPSESNSATCLMAILRTIRNEVDVPTFPQRVFLAVSLRYAPLLVVCVLGGADPLARLFILQTGRSEIFLTIHDHKRAGSRKETRSCSRGSSRLIFSRVD